MRSCWSYRWQWLALFGLLACSVPPDELPEVVVGVITPFERNLPTANGAKLAAEEINAAGGLLVGGQRYRVDVLVEDNASQPETSVSKALYMVSRENAVAVVGLPLSASAIPVANAAEKNGFVMVSTISTHPETTRDKRYAFRLTFLNDFQAQAMARFASEDLGAATAAVLVNAAHSYSTDLGQAFGEAFAACGGKVVASESFTEDDVDVDAQLTRIRESGAAVLFMPYTARAARRHVQRAEEMELGTTFLGADSWNTIRVFADDAAAPLPTGAYFIDVWAPDRANPRANAFVELHRRVHGEEPTTSAALGYDAVGLVAAALQAQGRVDREAVREGIVGLGPYEGASGTIEFRDGSGDPRRSAFIRKIEDDGSIRLVREVRPPDDTEGAP